MAIPGLRNLRPRTPVRRRAATRLKHPVVRFAHAKTGGGVEMPISALDRRCAAGSREKPISSALPARRHLSGGLAPGTRGPRRPGDISLFIYKIEELVIAIHGVGNQHLGFALARLGFLAHAAVCIDE